MCRNIKPLYNLKPAATDKEIRAAAIQFVRKIGGFNKPSAINFEAFEIAVEEITLASKKLLGLNIDNRTHIDTARQPEIFALTDTN